MPDHDQLPPVPEARTIPKKRTRLSLVWVIPIVAAAAGVWIAVTRIMSQGPEITIVFASAEGLEANKTKVTYNGLHVGTVTSFRLADDHKHVIATAQMSPKVKGFLVKDTRFWVVKPRVSGLNITGLGTLISGHYIGMQLGQSPVAVRQFTALESPPLMADVPGRMFTLKTAELGSLAVGVPVYFRQLPAGQVVSHELDQGGEFLNVKIFVEEPYTQYVTPDTRFWHASGIEVSLSGSGLRVQTESLMSILAGGVAFETPAAGSSNTLAEAGNTFTLFKNRTEAFRPPPYAPHEYLLVFKQSIRGLSVGAPVELGGVIIGEVVSISPQFDVERMEFSVPVTISVDAARYGVKLMGLSSSVDQNNRNQCVIGSMVSHGLRAQLKKASLISDALYVSVDVFPDLPTVTVDWSQNPVQLPTMPGQTEALEVSANHLMQSLDQTLVDVRGTLTNTDKLLNTAGTLIAPDSVLNAEIINLLQQGGGAARSLRVLADYLERHPEALIHGKAGEAKP